MTTTAVTSFATLCSADPTELVLWGFHPSYCDGDPIKLTTYSRAAQRQYERLGWTCHVYKGGTEPAGLRALAAAAKAAKADKTG